MSTQAQIASDKMIFRRTNRELGRHVSVTPANSTNKHLAYARIILNRSKPSASFSTGNRETGFVCLSGEATVKVGTETVAMGQYDAVYIPRDSSVEVASPSGVDIAEFSADVEKHYPLQIVRYAEIAKDPGLHFRTGGPGSSRELFMALAKNIEAGRLIVGFTFSDSGHWTSWPPHEHAQMLEEMYVYFAMPAPAYGIQLVYRDTEYPELVTVVRDGDAVLMPAGYHPNVSIPGHRICFLWAMAAHREIEDRQFGVVNVQPGFNQGSSGLEMGRKS
ncbi:MAG TPA: 5-deoxy-glucuronate isomerase [Candidatus Acidoferrales bacterium]|nr:5-deoxy-glucuronate isomerase [Candidatus Acidoferrales bacterium]